MTQDVFLPPTEDEGSESWSRFSELIGEGVRVEGMVRQTLLKTQLDAIKRTIRSHEEAREAEAYQFEILDTDPRWDTDYASALELLRDQRFWQMTFQSSAHSMAAVGMLAPFIESLFAAIFDGLKDKIALPTDHPRLALKARDVWNPQVYHGSKRARCDLLQGIGQLSDATGLARFLPPQTQTTLEALFRYRNNMFHNGFEWPDVKIASFADDLEKWPEGWFDLAKREGKPWLFYMTPEFCAHCVALIDGIIGGTGRYLKERGV
ncbi:hypothetical protein [Tropicibacter sp. S64]|uniref:hypothetical protein n=1 Tax=Tropicibacter sp. S64 TaxID=3415122 RepID=UPI003C7DE1DF